MYGNEVVKTFRELLLSFYALAASLCLITLTQLLVRMMGWNKVNGVLNFVIEYTLIMVPLVLIASVASEQAKVIFASTVVFLLLLAWRRNCLKLAQLRTYEMGARLPSLTVLRSLTYILTVICILAVDFRSFPIEFMKSRKFGSALMDTGIGLFVFSMGSVSHRLTTINRLKRLGRTVSLLLLLGVLRTSVIKFINYNQDVHEYGEHLNAFFTLGLTKLIASLLSALIKHDNHLLPVGLSIVVVHELILQLGVSHYVMDEKVARDHLFSANREGICPLPGFVAIYLLSLYLGRWLRSPEFPTYERFIGRAKMMASVLCLLWLAVFACVYTIGIARVTCNTGYIVWMMALIGTGIVYYMFVTELLLNTLWPIECTSTFDGGEADDKTAADRSQPLLLEAINRNGLVYFLIANLLTGGVNIFLRPRERSMPEGVAIMCAYTVIATGFVCVLFHCGIRIA